MSKHGAGAVLALVLAWTATSTPAAEEATPAYSPKGADTCLKCHDEDSEFPVVGIFRTPHGQKADARAPFAQLQCESCHGPGGEHAKKKPVGEPQGPIREFGLHEDTPVAEQDATCLQCHAGSKRAHWSGSAHEAAEVPCAACHQIHNPVDPVRHASTQTEVCGTCHASQRAQSLAPSAHPLRDGRMACTDCHTPHGSPADAELKRATVNDTCFECHADKRGPFLWEHAPAAEDCSLCHQAHGAPHRAMLAQRPPLLCQQCHTQAGHPSVAFTPGGVPSGAGTASAFLAGGSCANCHSQVHGSNHPSGADLGR
jgi:DmsE family decaheme c-type cytochrome